MATKKRVALPRRTGRILMEDVPFVPLYICVYLRRVEESRVEDAAVEKVLSGI